VERRSVRPLITSLSIDLEHEARGTRPGLRGDATDQRQKPHWDVRTGATAMESAGHLRTRGRCAWSVAGRRLGDRCIIVRPRRCFAAASGRAGQHVESSAGPAERCSTCAGRSSGRITDHALKGGIEAGPVTITAQVTCSDPLVDGDPREWRLPSGRQCAGGLEDQPPILSALGHTPSLSLNIKAGDREVGQPLRIPAVGSSALSAAEADVEAARLLAP
jgi:hypothetical protein